MITGPWMVMWGVAFALIVSACGGPRATPGPAAGVTPITVGDDISRIDLCAAIPVSDIEAALGRKLVVTPARFDFYDPWVASGCSYDGGKDAAGNACFGYVALLPPEAFDNQPLHQNVAVTGLGNAAFFNSGADARQLWVKVADKVSLVVAFGDVPREDSAVAIARQLVATIR